MAKKKENKDLVPFYTMRDNGKYKDDITVGLNGMIYKVQRGETVMIPRAVREILDHQKEQDDHTYGMIQGMENEYFKKNI